jgi:hypothetical protein
LAVSAAPARQFEQHVAILRAGKGRGERGDRGVLKAFEWRHKYREILHGVIAGRFQSREKGGGDCGEEDPDG